MYPFAQGSDISLTMVAFFIVPFTRSTMPFVFGVKSAV